MNAKNEVRKEMEHSEEEKMAAAYALNMCNVSVSQIVDYNDLYILEQEYDAILNNLNLKKIPKEEALLRILTELLNTITFFRIQEIKKTQIQKKYQQNMKNAIWSAVPSLSVFVSGNPVVMALSIATTVGTGYMNYRKEKANALQSKEDAEVELQITAIEQFNALRRELFTTAWRLAAEYNFDDHLRLTERQIKQYNEILMDPDEYRKYARLEAIQENFEAYPAFWYFFGHTANYIAANANESSTKNEYMKRARSHFDKYKELNKYTILREDNMTASFALEYIDLLYLEGDPDKDLINEFIGMALKNAGNNFDIIQLCTLNYLRIGDYQSAAKWLKILVNEDYNKVINAQILSGIYVGQRNIPDYELLTKRVSSQYLYPMPASDEIGSAKLIENFEKKQKEVLKAKLREVFKRISNKGTADLIREISTFYLSDNYDETYYENTRSAKQKRANDFRGLLCNEEQAGFYRSRIQSINIPLKYVELLRNVFNSLFSVSTFQDKDLQALVLQQSYDAVKKNRDVINDIQNSITNEKFDLKDYDALQNMGLKPFVEEAFTTLFHVFANKIDEASAEEMTTLEGELLNLCSLSEVDEPEIVISDSGKADFETMNLGFSAEMFGAEAVIARKNTSFLKEMVDYIKDKLKGCQIGGGVQLIYRGEKTFERYFNDDVFSKYPQLKANSLMIIKDESKDHFDLIFTTEGIVHLWKNKVKTKTPYEDVKFSGGELKLIGRKYNNENIDKAVLFDIANGFDKRFINNLSEKIVRIPGKVKGETLNKWFEDENETKINGIQMVYAWPRADLLKNMGYYLEEDLDSEHYLLQFYYVIDAGDILKLRIVEFDEMEAKLANALRNGGGVIKVER